MNLPATKKCILQLGMGVAQATDKNSSSSKNSLYGSVLLSLCNFANCSLICKQRLDISHSNLCCSSGDIEEWEGTDGFGFFSIWSSFEHSTSAFSSYLHELEINWSSLQLWPGGGGEVSQGTGGTRKGCWSSWGILHLSFRSHARHFFIRSKSQGFETGS